MQNNLPFSLHSDNSKKSSTEKPFKPVNPSPGLIQNIIAYSKALDYVKGSMKGYFVVMN